MVSLLIHDRFATSDRSRSQGHSCPLLLSPSMAPPLLEKARWPKRWPSIFLLTRWTRVSFIELWPEVFWTRALTHRILRWPLPLRKTCRWISSNGLICAERPLAKRRASALASRVSVLRFLISKSGSRQRTGPTAERFWTAETLELPFAPMPKSSCGSPLLPKSAQAVVLRKRLPLAIFHKRWRISRLRSRSAITESALGRSAR